MLPVTTTSTYAYYLSFVYTIQPVVIPVVDTGLTTGCIVYTAGCQTGCTTVLNDQPLFVQPGVKPGCTTGLTRLYNRIDNRLYRVNGVLHNLRTIKIFVIERAGFGEHFFIMLTWPKIATESRVLWHTVM